MIILKALIADTDIYFEGSWGLIVGLGILWVLGSELQLGFFSERFPPVRGSLPLRQSALGGLGVG